MKKITGSLNEDWKIEVKFIEEKHD